VRRQALGHGVLEQSARRQGSPEKNRSEIGWPCAISSWFGSMSPPPCLPRSCPPRPRHSDQHDGERAGPNLLQYVRVQGWQDQVGQPDGRSPTTRTPAGPHRQQADQNRDHRLPPPGRSTAGAKWPQQQHARGRLSEPVRHRRGKRSGRCCRSNQVWRRRTQTCPRFPQDAGTWPMIVTRYEAFDEPRSLAWE